VFSDHKVGLVQNNKTYLLVTPRALLVASGAREKSLAFKGNSLPGVYGAGAFQTLLNGARVRPSRRIFIVGGGNVGLIAGYHALQAGIEVVGLAEASSDCGGYRVHQDKLARMGVPIYTSHTVLSANGKGSVESITIARVNDKADPIRGTQRSFACDTVLIAAGLVPASEFYHKALDFGFAAFAAGDANEVAEASAAMFSGKIRGLEIARMLGQESGPVPREWHRTMAVLKSRPGKVRSRAATPRAGVFPVMHCTQEIPCNPCAAACPIGAIYIDEQDIRQVPAYIADQLGTVCIRCEKCVNVCPGLAITLVDMRNESDQALVTVPHELGKAFVGKGESVLAVDRFGKALGHFEVVRVRSGKATEGTVMVKLQVPRAIARDVAGIRAQPEAVTRALGYPVQHSLEDAMVCRCERVTEQAIVQFIQAGVRDMNQLKALTRTGMGPCGGQTCENLIRELFRHQGVPLEDVTPLVQRPLSVEVALGVFAGVGSDQSR
jgi:Fe-S-cluster-containing hydrogenase component 2/bacterioferritin-associated ferredoxin